MPKTMTCGRTRLASLEKVSRHLVLQTITGGKFKFSKESTPRMTSSPNNLARPGSMTPSGATELLPIACSISLSNSGWIPKTE
jgi:hypothetical protein